MEQRYEKISFSDKLFKNIISLRREVFCGEEGEKPAFIKDNRDEKGYHIVCAIGDDLLGCGSIYDNGNGEFEISKIAVKRDYRKFLIGSNILKELTNIAKEQGAKRIVGESTWSGSGTICYQQAYSFITGSSVRICTKDRSEPVIELYSG